MGEFKRNLGAPSVLFVDEFRRIKGALSVLFFEGIYKNLSGPNVFFDGILKNLRGPTIFFLERIYKNLKSANALFWKNFLFPTIFFF